MSPDFTLEPRRSRASARITGAATDLLTWAQGDIGYHSSRGGIGLHARCRGVNVQLHPIRLCTETCPARSGWSGPRYRSPRKTCSSGRSAHRHRLRVQRRCSRGHKLNENPASSKKRVGAAVDHFRRGLALESLAQRKTSSRGHKLSWRPFEPRRYWSARACRGV